MANRNFISQKLFSMHAYPVFITATAQIGASGSVSSFVGSMIQSVVHVSTGIYRIKCQDKTSFSRLYSAQSSVQSPVSGLSGIVGVEIQHDPNTSVQLTTGAEITVKCLDAAGALANPASGSAINIAVICSNSSVIIDGE